MEINESAVNTPQAIFPKSFDSFLPATWAKMKFRVLKQWLPRISKSSSLDRQTKTLFYLGAPDRFPGPCRK
jgi:hypothetical protein